MSGLICNMRGVIKPASDSKYLHPEWSWVFWDGISQVCCYPLGHTLHRDTPIFARDPPALVQPLYSSVWIYSERTVDCGRRVFEVKRFTQAVTHTMRQNGKFRSMSPSRSWLSTSTTCVQLLRRISGSGWSKCGRLFILISVTSTICDLVSTGTVHVMHQDLLPLSIYQRDWNEVHGAIVMRLTSTVFHRFYFSRKVWSCYIDLESTTVCQYCQWSRRH